MKRTKSAFSLRNLAMSIKQSIQLDEQKTAKKQPFPSKASKSVTHCMPKERNSEYTRTNKALNRQQKQNRIFVLERQITNLQKQLKSIQTCQKSHTKELQDYDRISKMQVKCQEEINSQRMGIQQLKNQILMLQEEIFSIDFNMQNKIAQKQYHEQLIDAYRSQYDAQSQLTIDILEIEEKSHDIGCQIEAIEKLIQSKRHSLSSWKQDIKFDLNEHKLKNNIKIIRTKLIEIQDQCDTFCNQNNLRKIRQLYCLYFKNYSKDKEIESEGGIDIFICKEKLTEDFSEFIRERLIYNKPKFPLLQEYIENLQKMQEVYTKSIYESNKKLHSKFVSEIANLQQLKEEKMRQIISNENEVKRLKERIDELFNNESIAVIEYMREKNENTYNLSHIKQRLRESKKQQQIRIQKMRQSYERIKELDRIMENSDETTATHSNTQQIAQLSEHLISAELQLSQLQANYFNILKNKNAIEESINQAITNWRVIDQKKMKLKDLYRQLEQVNNSQQIYDVRPDFNAKKQLQPAFKHSKNTSISSLHQNKSILSLSHPYKKVMEKSAEIYQPILSNCQMILSNKLTNKDQEFKCYQSKTTKILQQKCPNLARASSKNKIKSQLAEKQNDKLTVRNKKQPTSNQCKEKTKANHHRLTLSKLIMSRFDK